MHMDTIFHCEINAEVIILVASDTTVARTETYSLDWFQSAEPSEYIYIMYVLLYDMVAGKPFPVYPVLDHIFAIVPFRLTIPIPKHILIPVNRTARDLTDQSFHDLLVRLDITALVMALSTGYDT